MFTLLDLFGLVLVFNLVRKYILFVFFNKKDHWQNNDFIVQLLQ